MCCVVLFLCYCCARAERKTLIRTWDARVTVLRQDGCRHQVLAVHSPPPPPQICIDVVDALAFCHRGCDGALTGYILHRDVKPDNVLLGTAPDEAGGRLIAKLADFGVSKLVGGDGNAGGLTNVTGGIAFGTPGYMDPQVGRVLSVSALMCAQMW
jgi:serine/threonine protein kinase